MAKVGTLYIEEYEKIAYAGKAPIPVPSLLVAVQKVNIGAIGDASAASAAVNARTRFVRLKARGADAQFELGLAPTADAADRVLIKDVPEDYEIGPLWKVAVLQAEVPT